MKMDEYLPEEYSLLPSPDKLLNEYIDTICNIKAINHKHKFMKLGAEKTLEAIEKELEEHDERYKKLYEAHDNEWRRRVRNE